MKLGNVVVGQLKTPKNGLFNGRVISKQHLNDATWLKLLELPVPPEDGLYVRRDLGDALPPRKTKKKGFLYRIAKAMVDYERAPRGSAAASKTASAAATATAAAATASSSHPTSAAPPATPTSWLSLSPDIESELLGLEQLGPNERIAIVGAGITGLTLAYMLSKARPDVHITVLDDRSDVGGWMQSRTVEVRPGERVLFESGPRTLLPSHPGSEILARMLAEIGERPQLMRGVRRSASVNAKALVLDGAVSFLPRNWRETIAFLGWGPLLRGARLPALRDLFKPARRRDAHDESVHAFVSRRLGPVIADRMVSAVMRGIYAADSRKLSARSVARLNRLFYLERTEEMGVLAAMFSGSLGYLEAYQRQALPLAYDSLVLPPSKQAGRQASSSEKPGSAGGERSMAESSRHYSLYGFSAGIQSAARAIAEHLRANPRVTLKLGAPVTAIRRSGARCVVLETANNKETVEAEIAVATVAKPEMFSESAPAVARDLQQTHHTSLAVVNVWVPDEDAALDAFGVLVPRSEDGWNAERALGVIFDSSIRKHMQSLENSSSDSAAAAAAAAASPAPAAPGSCMTVMLGGDLWDGVEDKDVWRDRALRTLVKLGILDAKYLEPGSGVVTQTALQRNAIPLYEVGHSVKVQRVHAGIAAAYGNRVALAGMAYGRGCGVSDCVVDSLMLALRFSDQRKLLYPQFFFDNWWHATRPEQYA